MYFRFNQKTTLSIATFVQAPSVILMSFFLSNQRIYWSFVLMNRDCDRKEYFCSVTITRLGDVKWVIKEKVWVMNNDAGWKLTSGLITLMWIRICIVWWRIITAQKMSSQSRFFSIPIGFLLFFSFYAYTPYLKNIPGVNFFLNVYVTWNFIRHAHVSTDIFHLK